ncbi:MAG TPA: hypothetical protein VFV72_04610 [Candidatus Limnocylindrales bacterium]|nr:hypothetical protein [Candidatus Limnocylindrales bacterium]
MTDSGTASNRHPRVDPEAKPDEAGAYVGRKPERQAETIPGGVRPDDERIAAHSTQAGEGGGSEAPPTGHREGRNTDDDLVREAGENR